MRIRYISAIAAVCRNTGAINRGTECQRHNAARAAAALAIVSAGASDDHAIRRVSPSAARTRERSHKDHAAARAAARTHVVVRLTRTTAAAKAKVRAEAVRQRHTS